MTVTIVATTVSTGLTPGARNYRPCIAVQSGGGPVVYWVHPDVHATEELAAQRAIETVSAMCSGMELGFAHFGWCKRGE